MNRIEILSPNEILLLIGRLTSKIGNIIFDYANSVFIVELGSNASKLLALYQSTESIVGIVCNIIGGVVADRRSKKFVCIFTDICSSIICVILAFLLKSNSVGLFLVIANVILAVIETFNSPTYKSIVRELITEDKINRYNAISHGISETIKVVAPIVGLTLVKKIGLKGTLLINGATFMFSAIMEMMLKPLPGFETSPHKKTNLFFEVKSGFFYILGEKNILFLLCLSGLVNFFLAGYNLLLPFSDLIFSAVSDSFYGKAMSAEALGGIIGAFVCSKIKSGFFSINKMIALLASTGIALFLIPVSAILENVFISLAMFMIFSIFLTIYNIAFNTFIQLKVDRNYLGRVFSVIYTIAAFFMPMGSFLFSLFLNTESYSGYYVIGFGITLLTISAYVINKKMNTHI